VLAGQNENTKKGRSKKGKVGLEVDGKRSSSICAGKGMTGEENDVMSWKKRKWGGALNFEGFPVGGNR